MWIPFSHMYSRGLVCSVKAPMLWNSIIHTEKDFQPLLGSTAYTFAAAHTNKDQLHNYAVSEEVRDVQTFNIAQNFNFMSEETRRHLIFDLAITTSASTRG